MIVSLTSCHSLISASKKIEDQVRERLDEMTQLDRAYFGKDRLKQIKQKLEQCEKLLD
jgi:ATP-dependent Lon protease